MRKRWRLILPVIGILLFAVGTYESVRINRERIKQPTRHFWWSSLRLDTDPVHQRSQAATPCKDTPDNCAEWDAGFLSVEPGPLARLLMISGAPAFIVGISLARGVGHLGISEATSFLTAMPLLLAIWYYAVGRLLDRWIYKRSIRLKA